MRAMRRSAPWNRSSPPIRRRSGARRLLPTRQLYADKGKPDSALTAFQNCLDRGPPPRWLRGRIQDRRNLFRQERFRKSGRVFPKGGGTDAPADLRKGALQPPPKRVQAKNLDGFSRLKPISKRTFRRVRSWAGPTRIARLYEKAGQADRPATYRAPYKEPSARKRSSCSASPTSIATLTAT